MNVLLVIPGETPREVEIDGSLKSMQNIVGGLIQAIYPFDDPVALICNAEGKLIGLEPNRALRDTETGAIYDIIFGPFLICGLGNNDFDSLPSNLMEMYQNMFATPELFIKVGSKIIALP